MTYPKMMTSLRYHRIILMIVSMVFVGYAADSQTDESDLDVYPYWSFYGDVSNTLYKTLADRAFAQLDERRTHIQSLRTKEDWQERQDYVRRTLREIVGPFPARTPLNPVVTDTLVHDGMVIEKLYFESR